MRSNLFVNTNLAQHHVYRLGDLLLEANFYDVWTLKTVTESGYHVAREHGALVAYRLRADGLWDSVYDCQKRGFLGWKSWSFTYGTPRALDLGQLIYVSESRTILKAQFQERDVDRKFYEIMATMKL
jgi:hypothetical protein